MARRWYLNAIVELCFRMAEASAAAVPPVALDCRVDLQPQTVHTLDPFYGSITFVKAGTYTVGDTTVTLADRVVSQLRGGGA